MSITVKEIRFLIDYEETSTGKAMLAYPGYTGIVMGVGVIFRLCRLFVNMGSFPMLYKIDIDDLDAYLELPGIGKHLCEHGVFYKTDVGLRWGDFGILGGDLGVKMEQPGKEQPSGKEDLPGFEKFWEAYPRRVAKAAAMKAWKKLKPNDELQAMILAAIAKQKLDERQLKYQPHPSTWLNGRRWEDEEDGQAERKRPTAGDVGSTRRVRAQSGKYAGTTNGRVETQEQASDPLAASQEAGSRPD